MCKKSLLMMLLLALLVPWAANAQESTPYTEGFENMSTASDLTAAGWISYQSHSGSFLAIDETSSNVHTGTKALKIDSWNAGTNNDYVVVGLPTVNAAIKTLQITFSYKISSSYGGNMEVGYLTNVDDASTFVSLQTCANSTSYATETVELNGAPNDAARIAIKYIGYYRCYVDDIEVKTLPTCPKPTGLTASYNGDGTATASWTSDASLFNIDVNGTVTEGVTNPYTFNVDYSTTYSVKVQADCGSEQSEWTNSFSFTTPCAAIALPYFYDFEDPNDLNCWDVVATSTSTGIAAATDAPVGSNVFSFHYSERNAYLASPVFSGTEQGLTVSFQYMNSSTTSYYTEQFQVGYTTDANAAPADFTYGETIYGENQWVTYENTFPANTKRIAIKYIYTDGLYLRLDDFSFEVPSSCPKPTGLAVSNVVGHSATISWTSEASAWVVAYKTADATEFTEMDVTENPYTLTGLAPETAYQVKVQNNCGGGTYSVFTSPVSFTTTVACPAPTVAVSNITSSTADVTCTNTEASEFNLQFINPNVTPADTTTFANVTMPYPLTGLTQDKSYKVRVQAICGGEDGESAWSSVVTFTTAEECPEGMVCIGTGKTTNSYLPTYTYYNYSMTQQIYTAAEIGGAGAIMSIDFYMTTSQCTRKFDIYMVMTDKASFASNTDYISATASDLVYSGNVTFAQNDWTTIQLNTPFAYADDTKNVALIIIDQTGGYTPSSSAFRTFTATDMALYAYNDYNIYDPSNPGTYAIINNNDYPTPSFNKLSVKNRVRLVMGEIVDCDMPTNLAVSDITMQTANLTWTAGGSETAWQVCINGDEDNLIDVTNNAYPMTGLTAATTYTVKVRANCGNGQSYWTPEISFNTAICDAADQCEISYEFSVGSSYTTWHSATIDVVDVETNLVLATLTYDAEAPTGTVTVCDGREIKFVYNLATPAFYNSYNAFSFTDVNGEEIFSGTGNSSWTESTVLYTYTVSCIVTNCKRPTNLAVSEIGNHSAKLSWHENGEATEWIVAYTTDGETFTEVSATDTITTVTGLAAETLYGVKVRPVCDVDDRWSDMIGFTTDVACPAPTALEVVPTPISATVTWTGDASNYNLRYGTCAEPDPTQPVTIIFHADDVWHDGTGYQMLLDADATAYGTIIPENSGLTSAGDATDDVYAEFEYKIPANADGSCTTSNVVIDNTITLQIPAGTYDWCITNPTPGDRIWIASAQGNVGGRANDYVFEGGMTYEFHIYLLGSNDAVDVTIMCSNVDWTTVNNATSPYTINGLDPETEYYVGVQAVCGGEDGESAWTTTSFTTPSACDAPVNLEATDITYNAATLNWVGYQDSYTVRYRTAAHSEATPGGLFEDFESASLETNGWTVLREGEGTEYTDWRVFDGNFSSSTIPAHSGTYVVMGRSYSGSGYNVDNWLISPQVTLDGQLSYWVLDDGMYHEHYDVYVSTTTTETSAFTLVYEPGDASSEWTQHTVDLSSYAGQQGYIAFRLYDYDQDFMFLDDITIGSVVEVPAGEWETVTVNEPTYTLTGLTPETKYEWQVQGINPSCTETEGLTEWSEIQSFTTEEAPEPQGQTIELSASWNWVSTYISEADPIVMLQKLEAALGENAVEIKDMDYSTEYYGEDFGWFGDLDDVGMTNKGMVMVKATTACTIMLEGEPVAPEEHSITINPGWNWIGFPCSEEMSIEAAFAGFPSSEDDIIKSSEADTYYYGEEFGWFGDLDTLVPGQGYMYYSTSSEVKTLTFTLSARKGGK